VENVFGFDPTYTWHPQTGQSVAGEYNVLLDAYTYNISPSGRIYECHDTISKLITIINDNIMFPTVITPNGDGINDVFAIHNLIDGQAFPDNELAIYNRYGKRIYFVQDLRNPEDFWDPDKTNSPTGTYFYRFIGRGPIRNVEFKGSVEVLRDK
ncbi:MAG: gliding motility-associated C-terminal domain-containing protein, partial [Bacteroidales bacterium]|nr:gliding motility-associated C-terminal domain-containing protein [Bacteroidales bacterium]